MIEPADELELEDYLVLIDYNGIFVDWTVISVVLIGVICWIMLRNK